MEDGVTQEESLLSPLNLDSANGSKSEEKSSGFVSNGEFEDNKQGEEHSENGVINNLISSLITPMILRTGQVTEHENGNDLSNSEQLVQGSETENGGDKGLISNLISNFFHQIEGEGEVENEKKGNEDEKNRVVGENKKMKTEQESNGNGGGGIIHNLVSHLPPSLSDDIVLTSDEATILINSLVRD